MSERGRGVGSGWVWFAAILLMIAGFWNFFGGIAALANKEYFNQAGQLYKHLQFWGWVWLIVGVVQLLTSFLLLARSQIGRALGILIAGFSMLVWFFSIGAYPFWAFLVIAIDALIVYGLAAHGEEFE